MTQKELVIKAKLENEDEFLKRCVIVLFGYQEADEKAAKHTMHENGMGFNKADGNYLSDMALVYKNCYDLSDPSVATEQLPEVRRRMLKYAGQLARVLKDI